MKNNPIKRSLSLQPLSREHHQGLLLCWKIRTGLRKKVDLSRIQAFVDWFYQESLKKHFEIEEQYIFPVLGMNHEMVKRAMDDHKKLRKLFTEQEHTPETLSLLEEVLEKHIRFEERTLFGEIEKTAGQKELNLITEIHKEGHVANWSDEFWK